jgi:hypothetical protein
MKIEFNYFKDGRTGQNKLQLLDKDLMVIAILDSRDFAEMRRQGKEVGNLQDIVNYCNLCKATSIKEFTPTVFDSFPS